MNKEQEKSFKRLKEKKVGIIYITKNIDFKKNDYFSFENNNEELPIYYIFENSTFSEGVWIKAGINTHLIFKNCQFHKQICINSLGSVTFENNKYYDDAKYPTYPEHFFNCRAHNLRITEDRFVNSYGFNGNENNNFGLDIKTKFLIINNSTIDSVSGKIKVDSKELIIFNSNINTSIIDIETDDIYSINSHIKANNYIALRNINIEDNEIDGIESSVVIYNGEKTKVFTI